MNKIFFRFYSHSPLVRGTNGSGVTCCRNGQIIEQSLRHPDCFPIPIDRNDPFYGQFNQQCMEFVRSLPAVRPRCTFGPREHLIINRWIKWLLLSMAPLCTHQRLKQQVNWGNSVPVDSRCKHHYKATRCCQSKLIFALTSCSSDSAFELVSKILNL